MKLKIPNTEEANKTLSNDGISPMIIKMILGNTIEVEGNRNAQFFKTLNEDPDIAGWYLSKPPGAEFVE